MENLQDIKLSTNSDTGVAIIQFNRPAKRNAFSQNTIHEIVTTLDHLDSVDTVRVVVLTGGPEGHFCGKFKFLHRKNKDFLVGYGRCNNAAAN
jgi:enoyl-CoA hydratase